MAKDQFITLQAQRFMRAYCKPLQQLGIVNFIHDISFFKGELAMLTTESSIFQLYNKHRIPAVCTDENGRTLDSGIYLTPLLIKTHRDCSILMPKVLPKVKAKNALLILEREGDCQHLYSFLYSSQEAAFFHDAINSLHLLKNFIERYKQQAKEMILEVKKPSNRIMLPLAKDALLSDLQKLQLNNEQNICLFHKTTTLPIHLSPQQGRCFLLLMQGKSVKQIASSMDLSIRTVDNYLERLRVLLGCHSSKEILASYGHYLQFNSIG